MMYRKDPLWISNSIIYTIFWKPKPLHSKGKQQHSAPRVSHGALDELKIRILVLIFHRHQEERDLFTSHNPFALMNSSRSTPRGASRFIIHFHVRCELLSFLLQRWKIAFYCPSFTAQSRSINSLFVGGVSHFGVFNIAREDKKHFNICLSSYDGILGFSEIGYIGVNFVYTKSHKSRLQTGWCVASIFG